MVTVHHGLYMCMTQNIFCVRCPVQTHFTASSRLTCFQDFVRLEHQGRQPVRHAGSQEEQRRGVATPRERRHRPDRGRCTFGSTSLSRGDFWLVPQGVTWSSSSPSVGVVPTIPAVYLAKVTSRLVVVVLQPHHDVHLSVSPQDTLVAIRVTLPEKDEDTDEPSPAESLQMAVRMLVHDSLPIWRLVVFTRQCASRGMQPSLQSSRPEPALATTARDALM